ncbi:Mov34/MPN/PAD-1 family protein [Sphingomonas glacialis]|uniref:Mov34/MPN/PAD-1 family protein n=1 Tax=Sphingomonas glacialis TaxID=658225 RepID=UPI0013875B5B|nr:Mov34/MPN/PAD-1 family protein [Sphingomonas glacialis]
MTVKISRQLFAQSFEQLRCCGAGRRECQALWVGPWSDPELITRMVHPTHSASAGGFQLDGAWLTHFWTELGEAGEGVRVQVHTHPGAAYHSATDDAFPILAVPGFLSLVIPRFATGDIGFDAAFLAQLDDAGRWSEVSIHDHLEII